MPQGKNSKMRKWSHSINFVKQLLLKECCQFVERTHKGVNEAWSILAHTLNRSCDGPYNKVDLFILENR